MSGLNPHARFCTSFQHSGWCAVLLFALVLASGCSNFAEPRQDAPAPGPEPGYGKFVATYMRGTFPHLSTYDAAEISAPRWVEGKMGWSWRACVRFQDRGRRQTYAVFFKGSDIVDGRYAVQTDGCSPETYLPLDLATGTLRPGAVGDTGPLY